ncbi:tail fiber assembly protein [Pseudomonas frederiksbergensis]|uniref:tail fiber assembly protein n=1 Tax=Pseudomonas frederiksbergensis TaxID=104087 RepID=UPI000698FEF2|nr:tail fiber assembly protein [Pseudomonas frederiksbergensis]
MKTYAHIYNGLVVELFSTDLDITTLFHPSLVWVDVTDQPDVIPGWTAEQVDGVWVIAPYVPPPPTYAELLAVATNTRDSLLRQANDRLIIQPLQFKQDLGISSEEEEATLLLWKQYCIEVSNAELQAGWPGNVLWPAVPGS